MTSIHFNITCLGSNYLMLKTASLDAITSSQRGSCIYIMTVSHNHHVPGDNVEKSYIDTKNARDFGFYLRVRQYRTLGQVDICFLFPFCFDVPDVS